MRHKVVQRSGGSGPATPESTHEFTAPSLMDSLIAMAVDSTAGDINTTAAGADNTTAAGAVNTTTAAAGAVSTTAADVPNTTAAGTYGGSCLWWNGSSDDGLPKTPSVIPGIETMPLSAMPDSMGQQPEQNQWKELQQPQQQMQHRHQLALQQQLQHRHQLALQQQLQQNQQQQQPQQNQQRELWKELQQKQHHQQQHEQHQLPLQQQLQQNQQQQQPRQNQQTELWKELQQKRHQQQHEQYQLPLQQQLQQNQQQQQPQQNQQTELWKELQQKQHQQQHQQHQLLLHQPISQQQQLGPGPLSGPETGSILLSLLMKELPSAQAKALPDSRVRSDTLQVNVSSLDGGQLLQTEECQGRTFQMPAPHNKCLKFCTSSAVHKYEADDCGKCSCTSEELMILKNEIKIEEWEDNGERYDECGEGHDDTHVNTNLMVSDDEATKSSDERYDECGEGRDGTKHPLNVNTNLMVSDDEATKSSDERYDECGEGRDNTKHPLNVNTNLMVSDDEETKSSDGRYWYDECGERHYDTNHPLNVNANLMFSDDEATKPNQGNKESGMGHLDGSASYLEGPLLSRLKGLASSGLEYPTLSGLEGPASSGLEGTASSHLEGLASLGLEGPVSSRLENPASLHLEGPVSSRLKSPASSRLKGPASSRLEGPASSRLEGPASSGLECPASSGLEGPASSRLEGLASSCLEGPASSRLEGPALSGLEGPVSSRLENPVSLHLEGPVSSRLESPVSSCLEGLASSRLEGPASSRLEGPASSRLEGPVLSHLEGPASLHLEGPASSHLEGPASLRLEGPASPYLKGPASSHLEGPASLRLEGPASSRISATEVHDSDSFVDSSCEDESSEADDSDSDWTPHGMAADVMCTSDEYSNDGGGSESNYNASDTRGNRGSVASQEVPSNSVDLTRPPNAKDVAFTAYQPPEPFPYNPLQSKRGLLENMASQPSPSYNIQLRKSLSTQDMQVIAAKEPLQPSGPFPSNTHQNATGFCENIASQQTSSNKLHFKKPLITQDKQCNASNLPSESLGSLSHDSHQNLRGFPKNIISHQFPSDTAHFTEPLNTQEKQFILNGPCQPPGPFPPNSLLNGKCFSESYYTVENKAGMVLPRRWLCYSAASDCVYCQACWLFSPAKRASSWIIGKRDWDCMANNIRIHETSSHHLYSCTILEQWRMHETLTKDVQEDMKKKALFWKQVFERIINTTLTLAASNISLGNKQQQGRIYDNHGNFLSIITLLSKYDPVLSELLNMPGAAGKFWSPRIQKDFIDLLSKSIRDDIIKDVNSAPFFSVMMTTTQDLGKTDQLSQVVRYVSVRTEQSGKPVEIQIQESFLGFVTIDNQSAAGLDILKLRGQSYDGAASMSGIYSDLQAAINSIQPKAAYVHCAFHDLKVVLKDAMSNVMEVKNFFSVIENVYSFFTLNFSQWQKLSLFSSVSNFTLERLCPTSWSSWYDTLMALRYSLADLLKLLSDMILLSKKEDEVSEATALKSKMEQFQFIFLTVLLTNIFESVSRFSMLLYSPQCDLGKAADLLQTSYTALQETRNKYGSIQEASVGIARTLGVSVCFEKIQASRVNKVSDKLCDGKKSIFSEKWFKVNVFYATLDIASTQTKLRSGTLTHVVSTFKALQPSVLMSATDDELFAAGEILVKQYEADLSPTLPSQLLSFRSLIRPELCKISTVLEIASLLMVEKHILSPSFPDICTACILFLTLPVTVAPCERSLSKLQCINNYLRSTLSQERLCSLAMLSIENERAKKLNMSNIIDTLFKLVTRESTAIGYQPDICPVCPLPTFESRPATSTSNNNNQYNFPFSNIPGSSDLDLHLIKHPSSRSALRGTAQEGGTRFRSPLRSASHPYLRQPQLYLSTREEVLSRQFEGIDSSTHQNPPDHVRLTRPTHVSGAQRRRERRLASVPHLHGLGQRARHERGLNTVPHLRSLGQRARHPAGTADNPVILSSDSKNLIGNETPLPSITSANAHHRCIPNISTGVSVCENENESLAISTPHPPPSSPSPPTSPDTPLPSPSPPPFPLSPLPEPVLPKILEVFNNFRGAHVRYSFSIPSVDQPDPIRYLQTYQDFFILHLESTFNQQNLHYPQAQHIFPDLLLILQQWNVNDGEGECVRREHHMRLNTLLITRDRCDFLIKHWIDAFNSKLEKELNQEEGSGFTIESIKSFHTNHTLVQNPVRLGTYVPYPAGLRGKRLIFNPDGVNNACLLQCLAVYIFRLQTGDPHRHAARNSQSLEWCYNYVNYGRLRFPISFESITQLEKLNKVSIYIYVLGLENKKYYISLARKGSSTHHNRIVPLLMLQNKHLILIKDFNQYISNMKGNSMRNPPHYGFCHSCLIGLPQDQIPDHEISCSVQQTLKFLPANEKIKFTNFGKAYGPSFTCFYDFECLLNPDNPVGMIETRHKAVAYSYIIINRAEKVVDVRTYLGPNAVNHFITSLLASWKHINRLEIEYPIDMTPEDVVKFNNQTVCELCSDPFDSPESKHKHHDHNLPNTNYIGAFCARCNLQFINSHKYLHTFSHHAPSDIGVILNELTLVPAPTVSILSSDGFKFMQVDINKKIRLVDSLPLMNGSLDTLAREHIQSRKPTHFTSSILAGVPLAAHTLLLKGKQKFCYDYITSMDKLDEPQLPPPVEFYNKLRQEHISDEDYAHAQQVFMAGQCKNIGDYLVLYLKVNTGLLADIFTVWRQTLLEIYKLDITYYVSLSSYSWDAFLLKSKVQLDVISDPNLYDLLRRNLRGGFTSVNKQITTAHNMFTTESPPDESNYILYLDFNSLYATCMTELLPSGDIRQLSPEECVAFVQQGLHSHTCDGDKGYWVLCDTKHVAPDVARRTDDLPLTLSHTNITEEYLSDYSLNILKAEKRKLPKMNTKLISSHLPQKDYLVSLDLLQLLIKLGLEVSRVHAVYEFSQSRYLKDFVDTNIRERTNTSCPIKSKAFKLVSNSIYGKSLTNIAKYGDHHLACTREKFLKHACDPFFKRATILGQDRVICTTKKQSLTVNTPSYLGFHILQVAQKLLYDFWHNTVKAHYGDKAKLVYTDTDSFVIELTCKNAFDEMNKLPLKDCIDFSNFPTDHHLFSVANKGKLGLLKSEVGSTVIAEIIALKPKSYSIILQDQHHISRCKGISSHHQALLTHATYQQTAISNTSDSFVCYSIRNVGGEMTTCRTVKRGLSAFDDKRYVISPNETLAYGHPDIPTNQDENEVMEVREEEEIVMVGGSPSADLEPATTATPAAAAAAVQGFSFMDMWCKRTAMGQNLYHH